MKKPLFLIGILFTANNVFSQNIIPKDYTYIKQIVQPDIIQLPDSVITFPLTGLTYIRVIPGSLICGTHTEIELWIVDAKGQIIYNNITTNTPGNPNLIPFETEYRRYMKLQYHYLLQQRHSINSLTLH